MKSSTGVNECAHLNVNEPRGEIFPCEDFDVVLRSCDPEPARLHITAADWDVEFSIDCGNLYKVKKAGKDEKILRYMKDRVAEWLDAPCAILPSITNRQSAQLSWEQLHG